MRDYKLVVLGAGGVGKSSITVQFVQGVYVESYDPTIEDSYRKQIEVDGRACDLEILDTAGVAQFTAMRELYIKSGKGFLLVYSVTDENSLQELESIRQQLVRIKDTENVPMLLIGNKCDLDDEREVSAEQGIAISQKWGKVPFYETSAMYKTNVEEAFVDVVRQIIRKEVGGGNGSLTQLLHQQQQKSVSSSQHMQQSQQYGQEYNDQQQQQQQQQQRKQSNVGQGIKVNNGNNNNTNSNSNNNNNNNTKSGVRNDGKGKKKNKKKNKCVIL